MPDVGTVPLALKSTICKARQIQTSIVKYLKQGRLLLRFRCGCREVPYAGLSCIWGNSDVQFLGERVDW